MTNKEAIKRIKDFALYHAIRDLPNSAYTVEAFEMAIKALEQSEQKWIPVSKKLPKEDTSVLVTDDAGGMATVGIDSCGRYEDTGERFWYTSQNVTAWMYTVEPYGGEQDD